MKNLIKHAAICCAALISFSCQEIELSVTESPSVEPCTLNASIEDTRTLLNGLKTTWVKDDPVAIIDGTSCRTFSVTESGSSTTLKGELAAGCENVGGVFPWTSNTSIHSSNNQVIKTTAFHVEQTVADGSNLPLYAPWTSVDAVLCFKQLGAVVKFEIGMENANQFKSVKFEDNSSSLNISGPAFVNLATGNVAKSGAQYDYVIYKPASGTIPAGTYYLPIKVEGAPDSGAEPSITFAKGVTFTFETTDGKHYQIGSPQSLTVSRGDMCDFGELNPLGPIEPFTYPEVGGIRPIVNMLYGSEKVSTTEDMKGTINFVHITDGIQLTDENGYAVAGATITVPGNTSFTVPCGNQIHDTYCLVKGFGPGSDKPIYFSTPVSEKVSGELELSGCLNQSGKFLSSLKLEWSTNTTDNKNWNEFTAVYGKNQQDLSSASEKSTLSYSTLRSNDEGWFTGEFEIPEPSAVPAGGTLYFRLTPTFSNAMTPTSTLRINQGFIVKSRMENTSFGGNDILASNNFSECVSGVDCVIGQSVRYFNFLGAGPVPAMGGWTFTYPTGKPFNSMRGCVCTQSCTNSAPAYITSPALSAISATADVVVTFKVCTYFPATEALGADLISVSATDCGMALPVIKCSEMVPAGADYTTPALFQWHTYYALIRRATADTKVSVGVVATSPTTGDARYFIDDIVITKL